MDNMLIEQKRAELQVKLTILKENLSHLKEQMDKSSNSIGNISSQLHLVNKIKEAKCKEIMSLESELQKESNAFNNLKVYCQGLMRDNENSANESLLYKNKLNDLLHQNAELKARISEMTNKKKEPSSPSTMGTNTNQYDSNNNSQKKMKVLKIKMESLNNDIKTLEDESIKDKCNEEYDDDYLNPSTNDRNYNPLNINENKEGIDLYDMQIKCVQKEIIQTKQYISSIKGKNESLTKELNKLAGLLLHINKTNIEINASLNIIKASLSKKAAYLAHDQDYYQNCLKAKNQLMNTLQKII